MSSNISLKELERKAWRSTYEDGLWDIYYGLIVICMGFFVTRPETGYSPLNIIIMTAAFAICGGLFWVGKRWITLPRMGQVKFGTQRKKRKVTMSIVLGVVILIQVGFLLVQLYGWLNPAFGAQINLYLGEQDLMGVAVALVGSLFVITGMTVVAYFQDFQRGFYIAALMSLAVFLLIWLNQPVFGLIIGAVIILPGVVLLVRFLRKYPAVHMEG
jgi:hypothetical protein